MCVFGGDVPPDILIGGTCPPVPRFRRPCPYGLAPQELANEVRLLMTCETTNERGSGVGTLLMQSLIPEEYLCQEHTISFAV